MAVLISVPASNPNIFSAFLKGFAVQTELGFLWLFDFFFPAAVLLSATQLKAEAGTPSQALVSAEIVNLQSCHLTTVRIKSKTSSFLSSQKSNAATSEHSHYLEEDVDKKFSLSLGSLFHSFSNIAFESSEQ